MDVRIGTPMEDVTLKKCYVDVQIEGNSCGVVQAPYLDLINVTQH